MSAAKIVPVPIGFVRMSMSVALTALPPLVIPWSGHCASPLMENPSESSAPSHVCPPTSEQPASARTVQAPAIIWKSVSSTLASTPNGTTAIASAVCGSAFIAKQSLSAWFAAICGRACVLVVSCHTDSTAMPEHACQ